MNNRNRKRQRKANRETPGAAPVKGARVDTGIRARNGRVEIMFSSHINFLDLSPGEAVLFAQNVSSAAGRAEGQRRRGVGTGKRVAKTSSETDS
jgi:hypothetical protein